MNHGQLRRTTDRRTQQADRLSRLASALLITGKRIDWRDKVGKSPNPALVAAKGGVEK